MSEDKRAPKRRGVTRFVTGGLAVIGGLVVLGLAAMGLMSVLGSKAAREKKEIESSLVTSVKRGDVGIEVIETGKVQPRERVEVKSKVAGSVEKVFVEEAQRVKRGQLLLRLDATDYRREVDRCQSDVETAKLAMEFAALSLDRRKKGLESRGVSAADVEFAVNDLQAKKVAVDRANVALAGARDKLRYTEITSPLDGTVIEKGIRVGEVVTPGVQATFEGKPLLTVADLSVLVVKADLNQIDVAKIKLDQVVTLTLDALPGKLYHAKITKVAPASTTPKGKDVDVFPVEATLTDADILIKPGMSADVRIHIETRAGVLRLPLEAVVKDAGKMWVWKLIPDAKGHDRMEKVEVKTGARNDRDVEISSGLDEGQRVLIKPASAADNEFKG